MSKISKISTKIIIWLIHLYQSKAPPQLRASCRFEPSCSNYMHLAILKYGILKGIYLGFKRLLRCKIPNSGIDYP